MRRFSEVLLATVTSLIVAALILTASFSALLTPWPTHVFASLYADESYSGYTHAQVVDVSDQILSYCLGNDSPTFPQGSDYVTQIDPTAMSHLLDVRGLFRGVLAAAALCAALLLVAGILYGVRRHLWRFGHAMVAGGIIVLVLAASACVWGIMDFGAFFNFLHSFFFKDASWLFPGNSLLICALPERFWTAMGVLWLVILAVLVAASVLIGRRLGRSHR